MKQRLGIADVLIKDPKLVILDEPTEGLDVKIANQILENIQILNIQKKITFLICSHQLNLIQRICTRIGIMSKGKMIGEGQIDNLGRGLFSAGKYKIETDRVPAVTPEIIEKISSIDKVLDVEQVDNVIEITSDESMAWGYLVSMHVVNLLGVASSSIVKSIVQQRNGESIPKTGY